MKHQQAIRLAVECMQAEIHRLAIPANLHEQYGADMPHAITASKRRKELKQAIAVLKGQPRLEATA